MNHKVTVFIIGLIAMLPVVATEQIYFDQLTPAETSKVLGWVKDKDSCNICGGHYFESSHVINTPDPGAFQEAPMDVTAVEPAFFVKHGMSIVQGNVILRQPGREIFADKVTFLRDDKVGKLTAGTLYGNVKFKEYGKLVVANRGSSDFVNKLYSLEHVVYRLLANTPTGLENIWGRAKYAIRDAAGVLKFKRATYSTCPPSATTWYLWGNNLTLNRNTGRGEATNTLIFIKKIPVFYTPYFNFPIDDLRKSGFLMPSPNYSKDSGLAINVPYYFNLAPNYDAFFTPNFFTKRGVLFEGLFKYLTPTSVGHVDVSYIPYDRAFAEFRDAATLNNNANVGVLQALKNSTSGRGFLSLKNDSHFDAHWRSEVYVNYTTDDYFVRDFNVSNVWGEKDQLLNRADISYAGDRWNFLGRVQIFQTLQQITQQGITEQYMRLPQLNLSGDFPSGFGGLDYRLDSEVVNFMHRDSEYTPKLSGVRFNMMPSISVPFEWAGVNIVPRVQLQMVGYDTHDQTKSRSDNNITRSYPLVSVDSGTVFKKDISFFRNEYVQTLEPRLFYLLVPMRNQNDVPVFDTYLPGFDFNQLFRMNRFSGIDRVGDAHQVAVAVTTRFLNDYGQEKLNAGLGQIIVFHKHQVTVNDSYDPLKNESLSPLVGKLQYFINDNINTTVNMAWDPNNHRLNTAESKLQYINSPDRIINLWYNYAFHADQKLKGQYIDLSRLGVSVGWNIWQHWNIIGSLNYNTSYGLAQNYLYGVEYDSCCWTMRVVRSRDFNGIGMVDNVGNYDSRTYVQFLLKGLGESGDSGLSALLASQVGGYQDKFKKRV